MARCLLSARPYAPPPNPASAPVVPPCCARAAYIYSILSIVYSRVQAQYESHGLFFETSALLITFVCLGEAEVLCWQGSGAVMNIKHILTTRAHIGVSLWSSPLCGNEAWVTLPLSAGKYLEAAAKGRTSSAISALLRLAPATAILCHTDEQVRAGQHWLFIFAAGEDCCWRHLPSSSPLLPANDHAACAVLCSCCAHAMLQGRVTGEQEVPASLLQRGDKLKVRRNCMCGSEFGISRFQV